VAATFEDFWNSTYGNQKPSRTGEILSGIGKGLESYADYQLKNKQLQQSANNSLQSAYTDKANALQRQYEFNQNNQLQRGQAVKDDPYQQMAFAQRQNLLGAILPQLRNFSASYRPTSGAYSNTQISGGFRLPEGGLPQSVLQGYSPEATQAVLEAAQKNSLNIDPRANFMDLRTIYNEGADGTMGRVGQYQQNALQQDQAAQQDANKNILAALDQAIEAQKAQQKKSKGSPWWKKALGLGAMVGGTLLAPMTGGASLAAAGALNGALSGGGLGGAILGGASGYAGAKLGGLGQSGPAVPPPTPQFPATGDPWARNFFAPQSLRF